MRGCYGWVVVFASHVCSWFVFGWYQAIGPLIVVIQHYFEETSERTSWILAVFIFLQMSVGPVSNVCVKKFGFRVIVMIGTVMSSIGFFISAYATRIEFLYFSVGILVGIGYGLIVPAHFGILPFYVKKRFTLANSLVMTGSGIGTFVFPPLMHYLIDSFGWRGAIIIFSGINAHMGISAALYRTPERVETIHDVMRETDSEVKKSNICRDHCEVWDFSLLRRNPLLVAFTLANLFGIGIGYLALPAHLFARAEAMNLGTQGQLALIISIYGASSLIGRWVPPPLVYISSKRCTAVMWFGIALLLTGIITLLSSLATAYVTYAIYASFVGFSSGAFFSFANPAQKEIVEPQNFTAAVGFTGLATSIGGVMGPPVAGYIYDVTGDYNNSFYFYGAFLILGGLIAIVPEPFLAKKRNTSNDVNADETLQKPLYDDGSKSCSNVVATQNGPLLQKKDDTLYN
ncbi:monocarboxylate transporter 13-like [Ptychodera flava]|uniref:monocarboxylate transporter 13-like n=1 Tax=Ptychodera flava TaxID=63121 RepID=UPI00396A0E1F